MKQALFAAALALATPLAADAQTAAKPPCTPCAGLRVTDPAAVAAALAERPRLGDDERLYVAWPAELDGSTGSGPTTAEVAATGATPWRIARFRTPLPIAEHLAQLEGEIAELARLARAGGDRLHLEIDWQPAAGGGSAGPTPLDRAFLLKRAAVAVTGANPQARVIVGPLPADPALLTALWGEEIAAYVDGVALAPASADALAAAAAALAELDPGKPLVLDALDWPAEPARVLARAAEAAAGGFAIALFAPGADAEFTAADLAPLEILAREFAGDLSFDPYLVPRGAPGWTFVRGEDLALRVIVETPAGADRIEVMLPDPQLKSPAVIDPTSGEESPVFGQQRTADGLLLPLEDPPGAVLLAIERMTATELEGIEERLEVAGERQMPVEEILRRLQAFEDDQQRRIEHYRAVNTMYLRFLFGDGAASIEAAYSGPFFYRRGEPFDWMWDSFYVDGVEWRGKKIPEIPLVQPEKAAALPVEINLSKDYSYRLRGTEVIDGRDTWVIDFAPVAVEPGRSLYQGTVWVDREIYARVRTRTLQLGLQGDVLSNEEIRTYTPIDETGAAAPWSRDSFVLSTRLRGQQVLSVLNATVPVEVETELTAITINAPGFDEARRDAYASDATMVRDTDRGLRYLDKDDEGERFVVEETDTNRLFLAGGVFYDQSLDFPIPLAGINYFDLDFRGSGNQVNVFFGGALLTANLAEPRLFGSRWDAGVNLFGFFIDRGDELFRNGREVPAEEVESRTGQAAFSLGRPLGNFVKLDLGYRLRQDTYGRADTTAEDFVLPEDTLTHTASAGLAFNRTGYRIGVSGSVSRRDDWTFWGLPGNADFDPAQQEYSRWQATLAKTWWLPRFRKIGFELEHLDGSDLDRFSRYDFGIFGDVSVAGYPSGLVRAEQADGLHLVYGVSVGELFRVELEGDAALATSRDAGLDDELLAGIGIEGTVTLPWQMLVNFEVGTAVAGPAEGDFALRIVFLRLFGRR